MITPQQAYEAAKVLWPDLTLIKKFNGDGCTVPVKSPFEIDWGDIDQYPLPEPEWVDAVFPQDVGKPCRISIDGRNWRETTICGRWTDGIWITEWTADKFCQVRKVKT